MNSVVNQSSGTWGTPASPLNGVGLNSDIAAARENGRERNKRDSLKKKKGRK